MPDFVANSPELLNSIEKLVKTQIYNDKNISPATLFIPGGPDALTRLHSTKNMLNSPILDVIAGSGQYKLPQRSVAALLGSLALGDDEQPLSAPGAVAGYGAGVGLEQLIKHIRGTDLEGVIQNAEASGALKHTTPESLLSEVGDLVSAVNKNDMTEALTRKNNISKMLATLPAGVAQDRAIIENIIPTRAYYGGELASDGGASFTNLRKLMEKALKKAKPSEAFSPSDYAKMLGTELANAEALSAGPAGLGLGKALDTKVPSFMKGHELLELAQMGRPDKGITAEMIGGQLSLPGSNLLSGTNAIIANHASPAVLLRENNLLARSGDIPAYDFFKKLRSATGESALLDKILGVPYGDTILSEDYIKANSNNIADILESLKTNKLPSNELLDKVRVNKLTSLLGRASKSFSGVENSLAKALKHILGR